MNGIPIFPRFCHWVYYSKFDILIYLSDRSQSLESHGMVDFAYKLQLHYNIYTLTFLIWMENIIKVKIPLGSCELYAKRNMRIRKMRFSKSVICKICFKKGPTLMSRGDDIPRARIT